MRHGKILFLGLLLSGFLAGCPEPEDNVNAPGAGAQGGPPGGPGGQPPGAPGDQAAPGGAAPGAPPTADAGGGPPPGGGDGAAGGGAPGGGGMEPPPGLASLIKDGKSVTINGKIDGAKEVQVDFTAFDESSGSPRPKALEVVKVTDGTFTVKAPATYDSTIYVSALQDATGNGPTADDVQGGGIPIKLEGKDVSVTIKMGEMSAESKKLFGPPPDMPTPKDIPTSTSEADRKPAFAAPEGEGVPQGKPGEGQPGGVPPTGPAPTGAPPVGGATPPTGAAPASAPPG